jgi:hypothetical protein
MSRNRPRAGQAAGRQLLEAQRSADLASATLPVGRNFALHGVPMDSAGAAAWGRGDAASIDDA